MIFGDEQYLTADLNEDETVVIKPTKEFSQLITSMVQDIDMLHDQMENLWDIIREMQEKARDF
jgi:hypothetical protein